MNIEQVEEQILARMEAAFILGLPVDRFVLFHNCDCIPSEYFATEYGVTKVRKVLALPKDSLLFSTDSFIPRCPTCGREHLMQ